MAIYSTENSPHIAKSSRILVEFWKYAIELSRSCSARDLLPPTYHVTTLVKIGVFISFYSLLNSVMRSMCSQKSPHTKLRDMISSSELALSFKKLPTAFCHITHVQDVRAHSDVINVMADFKGYFSDSTRIFTTRSAVPRCSVIIHLPTSMSTSETST